MKIQFSPFLILLILVFILAYCVIKNSRKTTSISKKGAALPIDRGLISEKIVPLSREVKNLVVVGPFEFKISRSNNPTYSYELVQAGIDSLNFLVDGNTLYVTAREGVASNGQPVIDIAMFNLENLSLAGTASVEFVNLEIESLKLVAKEDTIVSGTGRVKKFDITVCDEAGANLADFCANDTKAFLKTIWECDIHTVNSLDLKSEGKSGACIYGLPTEVNMHISGRGSVSFPDEPGDDA